MLTLNMLTLPRSSRLLLLRFWGLAIDTAEDSVGGQKLSQNRLLSGVGRGQFRINPGQFPADSE